MCVRWIFCNENARHPWLKSVRLHYYSLWSLWFLPVQRDFPLFHHLLLHYIFFIVRWMNEYVCVYFCISARELFFTIFGILIVVLYNVRVRTQQFQPIYYTHIAIVFASIHPFADILFVHVVQRAHREIRLDPSLLQSFIMHQQSKINHRKAEIRWNATRRVPCPCPLHRLCKYVVMVLAI